MTVQFKQTICIHWVLKMFSTLFLIGIDGLNLNEPFLRICFDATLQAIDGLNLNEPLLRICFDATLQAKFFVGEKFLAQH